MEAFPQAQRYIPGYQDGGQGADQQQVIMQYLQIFAQLQNMKVEELVQALQQMPQEQQGKALQQIVQVVDQALAQQQGQQPGMAQQPEMAQQGEMPMDPSQAMQMAYGGASKLKKFTKKKAKGGMIEGYPAAAELPDSPVYRTFPPNFPRAFADGGSTLPEYQTLGNVFTPAPMVAESTVPFGQVYDPNTGRTDYPWYTKTAAYAVGVPAAAVAGYNLWTKGLPYIRDAYNVSPMRRPIPEGKMMADMSKDAPKTRRYFQEMLEEPGPVQSKTVDHLSKEEAELLKKHPEARYKDMTTKKTGTPKTVTYEVDGDPTKYGKYSEYGNAKFVQDKILPKHNLTPKQWAELGKTREGRYLQRQYVLEANGYKNLSKSLGIATKIIKRAKGLPTWAWVTAAAAAAGIGAGVYFYGEDNPETAESDVMLPPSTAEEDAYLKAWQADSVAKAKELQQSGQPMYLFGPQRPATRKYGGPASFSNYGAFTVPMAYGGSTQDALPGVFDTDAYLNEYTDNDFKRYLRENVDDSIYERMMERNNQMMRRGGSSKKKI